jgi:hypothetical protein
MIECCSKDAVLDSLLACSAYLPGWLHTRPECKSIRERERLLEVGAEEREEEGEGEGV